MITAHSHVNYSNDCTGGENLPVSESGALPRQHFMNIE